MFFSLKLKGLMFFFLLQCRGSIFLLQCSPSLHAAYALSTSSAEYSFFCVCTYTHGIAEK